MRGDPPRNPAFERKHPRDQYGRFRGRWVSQVVARLGLRRLRDTDVLERIFEYRDRQTGIRATIDNHIEGAAVDGHPNRIVIMDLLDRRGENVGEAQWSMYYHEARAHLDGVALADPSMQGGGFMSRWLAQIEPELKAEGVLGITLLANIDVGGYAWAKAGFDFLNEEDRSAVAVRFALHTDRYGPEIRAQINAMFRRRDTTPLEYAMLGWTPGAKTWPGKEIMLGSDWNAVKML